MKKRLSAIGLVLVLSLVLVVGCAQPTPQPTSGTTTPTQTPTTPAPSQPAASKTTLVCQMIYPGTVLGDAGYMGTMYKEYVEKATGGRVIIDLQPPGAVVQAGDLLSAVGAGTIDMTYAAAGLYWTGVMPEGSIEAGLPFAWLTAREAIEGYEVYGIGDHMQELYAQHNIHHQPVFFDTLYLILSTKAVNEPEDLNGLKVRAPGIYGEWVTGWGGSPITIPLTETYMAIKLGTMDASIMSPSYLEVSSLKEVIPYLVLSPNLNTIVGDVLINQDSLDKLPEDLRYIVAESGKYIAYYGGQLYKDLSYVQMAKDQYDLQIINWDEAAVARATEAGVKTWDQLATATPKCAELVEIVKQQLRDEGRIS
ncbi:MAG: TRAP transporter substrate-binding protein DctP [Dehalococcoidia bacterium]|nr:TRAP transporter substrate-binding protein DctP [Dehalococcoidia bacterium]